MSARQRLIAALEASPEVHAGEATALVEAFELEAVSELRSLRRRYAAAFEEFEVLTERLNRAVRACARYRRELAAVGRVTAPQPCCHFHKPSDCCDPQDCGPCCEDCPTCPTLANHAPGDGSAS